MTPTHAKVAALATFGVLAIFYLGSVILQLISWGWSWTFEAARADSTLAYSLTSRIVGGLLSLVVFGLCIGGSQWGKMRTSLAWILALGVAVVVVFDNLSSQAANVVVWLIAAAVVAVHVFGAIAVRRAALE